MDSSRIDHEVHSHARVEMDSSGRSMETGLDLLSLVARFGTGSLALSTLAGHCCQMHHPYRHDCCLLGGIPQPQIWIQEEKVCYSRSGLVSIHRGEVVNMTPASTPSPVLISSAGRGWIVIFRFPSPARAGSLCVGHGSSGHSRDS